MTLVVRGSEDLGNIAPSGGDVGLTIPADTLAVAFAVAGIDSNISGDVGAITIGGVACTTTETDYGASTGSMIVHCLDISGRANDNLEMAGSSGNAATWAAVYFDGGNLGWDVADSWASGCATCNDPISLSHSVTRPTEAVGDFLAIQAGSFYSYHWNELNSATQLYYDALDDLLIGSYKMLSGTETMGWSSTNNSYWSIVNGAVFYDGDIVDTPDPLTVEVNMPTPGITGVTDYVDHPAPLAVEVNMPIPAVSAPVPRQLPLVGVHSDMPGRVPVADGGLTTPVLSEVDGVPVWVEAPAGGAQNNYTAIIAPTVNDDVDLGYEVGSQWLDTVLKILWECTDATDGAAVWDVIGFDATQLKSNALSPHWVDLGPRMDASNPTFLQIGASSNTGGWADWGGAFCIQKSNEDDAVWIQARDDGFIIYQWDNVLDGAAVDASVAIELEERGSKPGNPETNGWKFYFKSDGFYVVDDAGTETGPMGSGGGSALTVTDESGTVSDAAVTSITVPNGSLVDNGVGDVTLREVPAGVLGAHAHRHNAVQVLSDATWTKLTLDTSDSDTDSYFDDGNDRMTIPAGLGGPHVIFAHSFVDATATNPQLAVYKNGSDWRRVEWETGANFSGHLPLIDLDAVATDYYEVWAYAATNADFGHGSVDSAQTHLYIHKLGSGNVGDAIGAAVYKSSDQTNMTAATLAKITWETTRYDTDSIFDDANDRFTIPTGLGGLWRFNGTLAMQQASGSNDFYGALKVNGAVVRYLHRGNYATTDVSWDFSEDLEVAAADYVELWLAPGSLGTVDVRSGAEWSRFSCVRMGGPIGPFNVGDAIGAKKYENGTQTTVTATDLAVTFTDEDWDTDGFHSTTSNPTRFTVPAGLDGKYIFGGKVYWVTAVDQTLTALKVYVDGVLTQNYDGENSSGSGNHSQTFSIVLDLAAGQYVEMFARQNSGGNITIGSTNRVLSNEASLVRIGGPAIVSPGEGTAFPTGPATDTRYYRTDHDLWFRYDGTRWLSEQLFSIEYYANLTATVNTARPALALDPRMVFFTDMIAAYVVNGTNNGSNYWSWKFTGLLGSTIYGADSSVAVSGSTYYNQTVAVDTIFASPEVQGYWTVTKTGSPGDWLGGLILQYRLTDT